VVLASVKGSSYGHTIQSQLDEERARKTSLESRGIGIVTSSGALATLLFGLVVFTRGNVNQFHVDIGGVAKWALIVGVLLFAVASLMGLAANLPLDYREASIQKLKERVVKAEWDAQDPVEAARYDAVLNVQVLEAARKINGVKAWLIFVGIAAEALAAVAVAVAVLAELVQLAG
jgi:hypothetical protein